MFKKIDRSRPYLHMARKGWKGFFANVTYIALGKVSYMDTSIFQGAETLNTTLHLQGENRECLCNWTVNTVIGNLELSL